MAKVDNEKKVGKILDLFLSLSDKDKNVVRNNLLIIQSPKKEIQIEG